MKNAQRDSESSVDVEEILYRVHEQRRIARQYRKSYKARQSKLEPHRSTVMAMHHRGASYTDISVALRTLLSPRVDCAASTVKRFIDATKSQESDSSTMYNSDR